MLDISIIMCRSGVLRMSKIYIRHIEQEHCVEVVNYNQFDFIVNHFHNWNLLPAPPEVEDEDDGRFDYPEPKEVNL